MIDLQKAAVYCGTYGKYAAGDLNGAWITLNEYATNEEFLKKCAQVHNDEKDPEFMFQDSQYLPSEMFTESIVYPEMFQVLARLRSWSERKLNAFADWCEKTAAIPDMFDVDTFSEQYNINIKKPTPKKQQAINKDFERFLEVVKNNYKDYTSKDFVDAIEIAPEKFITFDKEVFRLEKTFCWGWSSFGQGYEYDEAKELCKNFDEKKFKEKNLSMFDNWFKSEEELSELIELNQNKGIPVDTRFWAGDRKPYEYDIISSYNLNSKNSSGDIMTIDVKYKDIYLSKVAELRKEFEKRIDMYLKKYGVSKVKTWTYCCDD